MHDPGALVAAAFVAAVERDGLSPDPTLRLLAFAVSETLTPGTVPTDPYELGPLHEHAVAGAERSRRGAWYTPRWLAEDLVGRACSVAGLRTGDLLPAVADPSCGGGVFLLAAAERLPGTPSANIAALWGCDVDPLAVAVTEAALWWWSARRGDATVVGNRIVVGDALTTTIIPPVDLVVGNPPFLGQLRTATAADRERRDALRARFGGAVQPYTDAAWLFLLAAVEATRPGGAVVLVQPTSLLGARDAGAVRRRLDERATVVDTWIDDGSTFDAAVEACAPVLRCRALDDRGDAANDWTAPLSRSRGVPSVTLTGDDRIGRVAEVTAGFRDEYYGLVDAVREGGPGPALVTSGAIDPLRHRLDVATRFAKRRWTRPTVDPQVPTGRAARWVHGQMHPKLLVATQTRVLEAAVDPAGELVGSVPVIVIVPHDPEELWRLAAALHAPSVSAWMMQRSAGTALSNDACKPTASLLADVPLPIDDEVWAAAAGVARDIAGGEDRWEEFALLADRAHGIDDAGVRSWWLARLPVR